MSDTAHNDNIESVITSNTARIPLRYRESKEEAAKFLLIVDQCRRAGYQIVNPGISAIARWLSDGRAVDDFDEVTLIKKYGDEVTYDLTVPEGHAFAAGGFTVHNCNLPADATVDLVSDVYMRAWETGCKGFTIYRDGSRSGVLVAATDEDKTDHIITRNAPKRPEELPCEIHHANIKGEKWTILVGLMDGKPYEVLGGLSERIELPRKHTTGTIAKTSYKTKNARYDLVIGEEDEQFTVRNLVDVFDNPNHSAFTRTISLSLRHGVPINYLVEQLQKDKDADMFSFSRVVARTLKKYIEDGTQASGVKMEGCETPDRCDIKYIEGCATCAFCGAGFCG